eukprot:7389969-Prymnesium_polylepis.1
MASARAFPVETFTLERPVSAGPFLTLPLTPVGWPVTSSLRTSGSKVWFLRQSGGWPERRSKERHRMSAAESTRRCSQFEDQLASASKRAAEADERVETLSRELARYEKQVASCALRLKLLALVRQFHPDKTATTTPTEITAALNSLVEELDQ